MVREATCFRGLIFFCCYKLWLQRQLTKSNVIIFELEKNLWRARRAKVRSTDLSSSIIKTTFLELPKSLSIRQFGYTDNSVFMFFRPAVFSLLNKKQTQRQNGLVFVARQIYFKDRALPYGAFKRDLAMHRFS